MQPVDSSGLKVTRTSFRILKDSFLVRGRDVACTPVEFEGKSQIDRAIRDVTRESECEIRRPKRIS